MCLLFAQAKLDFPCFLKLYAACPGREFRSGLINIHRISN